jgi:TetR/AcrR family transcriptional regulator, copper-responsive repressor
MPRGRPRQFDRQDALRRAMRVFWRHGYQEASIQELTSAMGIASPSLYAAFGSKAELFCEAADLYLAEDAAPPDRALADRTTARGAVEAMLRANADLYSRPGQPRGCLFTRATSTCPQDDDALGRYLERRHRERLRNLGDRFQAAADAGEPLPGTPTELAELYDTIVQGMAVRAQEGATRRTLHRTIDIAMRTWDALLTAAPH